MRPISTFESLLTFAAMVAFLLACVAGWLGVAMLVQAVAKLFLLGWLA